jgi:head-tail adaptor
VSYTLAAGDLDRRITLQTRTVQRGATLGDELVTWPDGDTVWAKVLESATATTLQDTATDQAALYARPMKVRIRWRVLDKTNTRLSFEGRLLRITGTAELGRRVGLELAVEEWAHE